MGMSMQFTTHEDVELIVARRVAELERRLDPRAYDVRQVAERLGLSLSRVRELVSSSELPSFTIGKSRRVAQEDLAAFIDERRPQPAPPSADYGKPAPRSTGNTWLQDFRQMAYGTGENGSE